MPGSDRLQNSLGKTEPDSEEKLYDEVGWRNKWSFSLQNHSGDLGKGMNIVEPEA